MRTLRFKVSGQELIRAPGCDFSNIIAGTSGYLLAAFEFGQDWDGTVKSEVPDYSTNYLCNYFVAGNARVNTDIIGSYIFSNTIRFRVDSSIASTEGDFKKWLASRYEANEPVRLIYPLAVPTWEPLPADTQAALNALTAYTGRTTITVTAEGPEPDVAVEYVQDTRMVIADLQAQINAIRNGGTT